MYNTAARVKEFHYYTTLTKAFKSNLRWWHFFVNSWNDPNVITYKHLYQVIMDTSGSWGHGSQFRGHWFQYAWPAEWFMVGIMAKELLPIITSCAVLGPVLVTKDTELNAITKG